jgi:hypothetical protein
LRTRIHGVRAVSVSEEDLLDEQLRSARLSGPAARKPPAEKPGSAPRRRSTLGYLSPTDYEDRTLIDSGASLAASRLASPQQEIK